MKKINLYVFSTHTCSPLLSLRTMKSFISFPIDIMNLFYCNIAPNVISLLISTDIHESEVAYLSDFRAYNAVDRNVLNTGSGVPSVLSKIPRGLDKVKRWKASECRFFDLSKSLDFMDRWVPDPFLFIWYMFVGICELCYLWTILGEEVRELERLF